MPKNNLIAPDKISNKTTQFKTLEFYTSRVIADFVSNFVAMATGGHPGVNLNDAVKLAVPENHTLEPKRTTLSCVQPEL